MFNKNSGLTKYRIIIERSFRNETNVNSLTVPNFSEIYENTYATHDLTFLFYAGIANSTKHSLNANEEAA